MMKKTIAAATIALTLGGGGLALAQQATPRDGAAARPNTEDVAAYTDARIAGLKAGLKLTAEQEKNWPAVETAIRELAKERADRVAAAREARASANTQQPAPDALARLRRGADAMTARAAGLKKFADAAEPLYKSLDESQKRRFGALLRMGLRSAGGGHGHWQHRADNHR
jgi:zinc resistance-associated protein